jgi:hypothetical protein
MSVSKRVVQKFDMERFSVKLNDTAVKEQYQVKISDGFAALENFDDDYDDDDDDDVDISGAWESIRIGKLK